MNTRRLLPFGLLASILVLASPLAHADDSSVRSYLEEVRHASGTPALAVAVIDGTEVSTWLLGEDGDEQPVTPDTPFLIGSVAKTFTSSIVLQLADEGSISLEDEARTHLSWLDHGATIRQLLDHTAGYAAADGLAVSERYDADPSASEAARRLDHSGSIGRFQYSSANYLVLGALIEQITGRSFAEELRARITGPTQMASTDIDGDRAALPPGHRLWWGRPIGYAPDPEPSGAPYGYLVSTLDDLAAYAQAHLRGDLLSPEARGAAWSVQQETAAEQGYGLGWRIDATTETLRIHHTGATPGYFAHLMLIPEDGRAVIVLANAYSEAVAPTLAATAADVDRLSQGGDASLASGDPLLTAIPWVALAPLALAGIAVVIGLRRRPKTRRTRLALVVGSVVVAALLAAAPLFMGMTWHVARTWAPDAALALMIGVVGWVLVALLAIAAPKALRITDPPT